MALAALPSFAAGGKYILHNTPAYASTANKLKAEDPAKTMEVSIWLQPHNRSGLDALARELYDKNSANYRHWLKPADIAGEFAPTAAEAKTVQDFFTAHNLAVTAVGPNNFYVRARGTVADVQKAFHVQLNYYQAGDQTLRANASNPYVDGAAAALVQSISGLDTAQFEHPLDVRTATPPSSPVPTRNRGDVSAAASAADADFFQSVCFTGVKTETHTNNGNYPKATYRGNGYYSPTPGCGYSPANIYAAYGLNDLYARGFNGAGQTIVIVDWCGSPTIQQDANTFAARFGLPALTAANFSIIDVPKPSACGAVDMEINLDVEWAHAIAPGAKIDLVVPTTSDFEDVDEAILYSVNQGLGNVISGSYASPEFFTSTVELDKENLISEIAAVSGVSTNFASGDLGTYNVVHEPNNVSVPADLPYATGIGGVTLSLNADNSIAFQAGWENYESLMTNAGQINNPAQPLFFTGGAGGGPSAYFARPAYQTGVPGKFRQVPDIAWLADPFTGGVVVITQPTHLPEQLWYAVGGTSLACPMFSALWAIANQEAGMALGQAAPYLYSMPEGAITDVVPLRSTHNVTAVVEESSTMTHRYTTAETLEVIPGLFGGFYSAIWDAPSAQNTAIDVSFGEDYFLKVAVGWDDVTGVGVPNARVFADSFAPAGGKK